MKTLMIALVLSTSAFGCAENRPAESPSTASSSSTTSSTTSTTPASGAAPNASGTGSERNVGSPSPTSSDASNASVSSGNSGGAAPATSPATPVTPAPATDSKNVDNTKQNTRDRGGAALTPMDQGGGGDREITAAVRRAVVGDSALSFNAKNVKIITVGGKVTLRGPVKSDDEKASIEAKTKATPGVTSVDNQLEVKK